VPQSWSDEANAPQALKEVAHLKDPLSYRMKKAFLGNPLNRHSLDHQRLAKRYALGILASDCISSSAYGSEQILIALVPTFGLMAFNLLIPMTIVILAILVLLTLSYNNVIAKYTSSGGAYIVARENLGTFWSIVAAVALILDYIVTVAVQSASGVVALVSYFTSLTPYIVPITIGVIVLLTYGNLRGVKEAGKSFAAPTYLFVVAMFVVFGFGVYHAIKGNIPHLATSGDGLFTLGHSQGLLTIASVFILLRAFANGGSSLTGLEAISNGVSLFKAPEGRNARRTMNIMSGLLGTLVFGVSWFAHSMHVVPYTAGAPSVISVIAQNLVGAGLFGKIWFAFTQFSTMLILIAGANTVYNAFPILAANIARDGFLPRQLSKRGHKLVFSNGIILASLFAIGLILFTNGSVNALVALYALGVFTAFTITGIGMVVNARREKGKLWRIKAVISALAAATSLIVVIIFATVKFTEGAWLIVVTGPTLVILMYRFSIKYREEREVLAVSRQNERATSISRHDVTVLVDSVDVATLATIRYARSLKPRHLHAVHFVIDDERAERIRKAWDSSPAVEDISLEFIDCPDRRISNTAVDYAFRATAQQDVELTLILPRRSYSRFLGRLLHDQTAEDIAGSVSQLSRVVATIVPFDVEKIIHAQKHHLETSDHLPMVTEQPVKSATRRVNETPAVQNGEVSHYAENRIGINQATWRERAHIRGTVSAIRTAPSGGAPRIEVEVWDETGGITLQFIGRRSIVGLEVGATICAEGMVGEDDGALTILNPSYELII
jgi:amino acid transporter